MQAHKSRINLLPNQIRSDQSLSRVRLCDPMNRSTPGLPVQQEKDLNLNFLLLNPILFYSIKNLSNRTHFNRNREYLPKIRFSLHGMMLLKCSNWSINVKGKNECTGTTQRDGMGREEMQFTISAGFASVMPLHSFSWTIVIASLTGLPASTLPTQLCSVFKYAVYFFNVLKVCLF